MSIELFFWNFLSILFSLLIYYLVKNYLPKYFEAKATNQATKEDIGEITKIVENIKSDLLKQNEFLKAQLSFHNQHKLNFKNAEREAIFDFHKKKSAWLYSVIGFNFTPYNFENYKELKIVSADFSKRRYENDLADAHIVLFIHNQEFIQLKVDFNKSIIELQYVVEKAMRKYYYVNSKCEFDIELEKLHNTKREYELRGQLYNDISPIVDDHNKDSLELFQKVYDLNVKMVYLIHNKLKRLEETEDLKNIN